LAAGRVGERESPSTFEDTSLPRIRLTDIPRRAIIGLCNRPRSSRFYNRKLIMARYKMGMQRHYNFIISERVINIHYHLLELKSKKFNSIYHVEKLIINVRIAAHYANEMIDHAN